MKTSIYKYLAILTMTLFSLNSWSAQESKQSYKFVFKSLKKPITAQAFSKDEAFKIAAKECFQKLTGGKYPGEEKGMDIIDICANPKM